MGTEHHRNEPDRAPASLSLLNRVGAVVPFISVAVGSVMAATVILGSALLLDSVRNGPPWQVTVAGLFFLWCLVTEIWFLNTTCHVVLNGYRPFALEIALRQPRLPVLLRPISALWWGYQFLMILAWGIALSVYERQMPIAAVGIVAVITSSFSYLAFGYLLLAVTALTKEAIVIQRLWGWRGRWAVAHGTIIVAVKLLVVIFG